MPSLFKKQSSIDFLDKPKEGIFKDKPVASEVNSLKKNESNSLFN
jgi:hypothetical protein